MAAPDQILARVTTVLVQALGVEEDAVTPAASLLGDLGAESIDLLDIVFRLEREFAITIPSGELFIEPPSPGEAGYVRDGLMTTEGLAALRARMPYADLSDRELDRRLDNVIDLFTVDLLVRYVTWKLENGRGTAECAGETAPASPARAVGDRHRPAIRATAEGPTVPHVPAARCRPSGSSPTATARSIPGLVS